MLQAARRRSKAALGKLVKKGKKTQEEVDAILAKITTGLKENIAADCDLVIEAAVENMEIKKKTFKELDAICKPEAIFATNTSSLSITEIGARASASPVIGMHFFNPCSGDEAHRGNRRASTLRTETVDKVIAIANEIGKTPVEVNEGAGFVVNSILDPSWSTRRVGIYADGRCFRRGYRYRYEAWR